MNNNQKMELFNFYLDDETKQMCLAKLQKIIPDAKKGTLAALIRTLLWQFAHTENVNPRLIEAVKLNYVMSTIKNKRSNL